MPLCLEASNMVWVHKTHTYNKCMNSQTVSRSRPSRLTPTTHSPACVWDSPSSTWHHRSMSPNDIRSCCRGSPVSSPVSGEHVHLSRDGSDSFSHT
ncbi:hypothetical protein LDENG_00234620 [Lucifuga dentata]|nr:hypothetical protein LDENG_00234620 [Lucifuga dentata]